MALKLRVLSVCLEGEEHRILRSEGERVRWRWHICVHMHAGGLAWFVDFAQVPRPNWVARGRQ